MTVSAPLRTAPRLQRHAQSVNRFEIPKEIIPDGMSYEFKRTAIYGQEDKQHQINLRRNHWTPVPAKRHPEMFGTGDGPAMIEGMMLMERPSYLTEEARAEERDSATSQLGQQLARLDQIEGLGKGMEQTPTRINRVFERTAVPDDEPKK